MPDDDTLIMLPKFAYDPVVRALFRAGLVLVVILGALIGTAIFALGVLVGVLV